MDDTDDVTTYLRRLLLAGFALASIPLAAAAHGKASSSTAARPLVVRAYDGAGMDSAAIRTAAAVVRSTFERAGIPVVWRDCSPDSARDSWFCDQPPGPVEIVVRIHRAAVLIPPGVLGTSLFAGGAPTCLVTIWADHVLAMARGADVDAGILLGRAVAHEIGHVLLGTRVHASRGLMRARWTDHELVANAPLDWSFAPDDSRRLRRGLDGRQLLQADNVVPAGASGDESAIEGTSG